MAKRGNTFTITLKKPHLKWGSYRHTDSRGIMDNEGYIPIPADCAYKYNVFNSKGTGGQDILGKNIFNCRSLDGLFCGVLKAQGNQSKEEYAKQFAGNDNLRAISDWYDAIGANVGDRIRVTWESATDITIEKI